MDKLEIKRSLLLAHIKYFFKLLLFPLVLCISFIYRQTILRILMIATGISDDPSYELLEDTAAMYMEQGQGTSTIIFSLKLCGKPDLEKVKDKLIQAISYRTGRRLKAEDNCGQPYKPFYRLTWRMDTMFLVQFWIKCTDFNIDSHVKREVVESGESLDEKLRKISENYVRNKMSGSKPQWEVRLVCPLVDGQKRDTLVEYGLVVAVNHVYGDATSIIQLFRFGLCDKPFSVRVEPMDSNKEDGETLWKGASVAKIFDHIIRIVLGCFSYDKNCLLLERTRLPVTGLDYGEQISMEVMRDLRKKIPGLRTTAVYKAGFAKALRRILHEGVTFCPQTVSALATYACYPYTSLEMVNNVIVITIELPLNEASDNDLLTKCNKVIKASSEPFRLATLRKLMEACQCLLTPFLSSMFLILKPTIGFTNVVGPEEEISMFDGDRVTDMRFSAGIGSQGLAAICLVSYNGKIRPTAVIDRDLEVFIPGITKLGQYFSEAVKEIVAT